jgi:hypothetical protein
MAFFTTSILAGESIQAGSMVASLYRFEGF